MSNIPKVGEAFNVYLMLHDENGNILASPAVETGDIQYKIGTGNEANATFAMAGSEVRVTISAAQHTHHDVRIIAKDQTYPKQWMDQYIVIRSQPARQLKFDGSYLIELDASEKVLRHAPVSKVDNETRVGLWVEGGNP